LITALEHALNINDDYNVGVWLFALRKRENTMLVFENKMFRIMVNST